MTNIIQFPRGINTPDKPREMIRESWTYPRTDEQLLALIERSVIRRIYNPDATRLSDINEDGTL